MQFPLVSSIHARQNEINRRQKLSSLIVDSYGPTYQPTTGPLNSESKQTRPSKCMGIMKHIKFCRPLPRQRRLLFQPVTRAKSLGYNRIQSASRPYTSLLPHAQRQTDRQTQSFQSNLLTCQQPIPLHILLSEQSSSPFPPNQTNPSFLPQFNPHTP